GPHGGDTVQFTITYEPLRDKVQGMSRDSGGDSRQILTTACLVSGSSTSFAIAYPSWSTTLGPYAPKNFSPSSENFEMSLEYGAIVETRSSPLSIHAASAAMNL